VVFGRSVSQRLPQTRVRAVRYETDESGDFIDDQLFDGPALSLLDDILAFLRRHVPVAAKFSPDEAIRANVPQFPFDALHEGIVNALVHRDYSAFSGSVKINVYPRRLEIWNSGRLPRGITGKKLEMAQHESILVNPDISHVFYLHGHMERVGRGTYNMVRQCRALGMRTPTWKHRNQGVQLTFHSGQLDLRHEFNRRQLELIESAKPGEEILTSIYGKQFAHGVSARTARRDLERLEDFGFIERSGVGRGTFFVRTNKELE
jgi:ATP-dependent DNA helicase RecG